MPTNAPRYEEVFAERLRAYRIERGLSQADVAEMATQLGLPGMHQQTIQKIESKKRPVRVNEAEVLGRVVGFPGLSIELTALSPAGIRKRIKSTKEQIADDQTRLTAAEAARDAVQEALREAERKVARMRAWRETNVLQLEDLERRLEAEQEVEH
jgi:transcriptional regulator with XRE-family HTH domain